MIVSNLAETGKKVMSYNFQDIPREFLFHIRVIHKNKQLK